MSTAFDEETTIEDTCVFNQGSETVFPTDDELFTAAKKEFALALSEDVGGSLTYSLKGWIGCSSCAKKTEMSKVLNAGAEAFYRTASLERAQSMSDFFVLDCIKNGENNEAKCNPFEGLGKRDVTVVKSNDYKCVTDRVIGSKCYQLVSNQWDLWVVYYIYTENSGNYIGMHSGAEWCIGAYFRYAGETNNRRLRCGWYHNSWAEVYRSSMLQGMKNAVDSVKQDVEACFSRGCGLDTKVSWI